MEDDLLVQPLVVKLIGVGERTLCQIHTLKSLKLSLLRQPAAVLTYFPPSHSWLPISFLLFKDTITKYKAPYYVASCIF